MATKLVPQPLDLDEVALTELSHTIWMPGRLAGMPGLLTHEDVCKELQAAFPFVQPTHPVWDELAQRLTACELSVLQAYHICGAACDKSHGHCWDLHRCGGGSEPPSMLASLANVMPAVQQRALTIFSPLGWGKKRTFRRLWTSPHLSLLDHGPNPMSTLLSKLWQLGGKYFLDGQRNYDMCSPQWPAQCNLWRRRCTLSDARVLERWQP